jgi:hypothetical protein
MTHQAKPQRAITDLENLPLDFPTHRHSPEFWEQLGRTVATYGFLEEVLGKAIFAYTATRIYEPEEAEIAYEAWLPTLERALTDQLSRLAKSYQNAVRDNPDNTTDNMDDLVDDIEKATVIRNVLCHGSWRSPDANGASVPLFVNRKLGVFRTAIDTVYLRQVQIHVAELACAVMNSVTHLGRQFPGGGGPGKPIA